MNGNFTKEQELKRTAEMMLEIMSSSKYKNTTEKLFYALYLFKDSNRLNHEDLKIILDNIQRNINYEIERVYTVKIILGDSSGDGHGHTTTYFIKCNKTREQIEELYKKSCAVTKLQFNTNGDDSGSNRCWEEVKKYKLLTEHEEAMLSDFQIDILKSHGVVIENPNIDEPDDLLKLFMDFISISFEDLRWSIIDDPHERVGVSIGYGIYKDY